MPCCDQMSDTDFERYLELVCDGWERKMDTFDMANEIKIKEYDVYSILICMRDSVYQCRIDEMEADKQ